MTPATEFEILRSLHTLWVQDLITWEKLEELIFKSTQLEVIYMNAETITVESLDSQTKYRID
jgi:hypothetical protein